MAALMIKLSGEILSSNFEEWKADLIERIQSTNTELATDAEFATAADHVKQFKVAEQALKKAKQSAISQAADIQQLFAAIDEVSEEVRQVRLALERQIKVRKQEIREEYVDSGLARVEKILEEQDEDFRLLDHSDYLDASRFEAEIKGKSSVNGISNAVDKLCAEIKREIQSKAMDVRANAKVLAALPTGHQALFQDRPALLDMEREELNETIDLRIETFKKSVEVPDEEGANDIDDDVEDEVDTIESDEAEDDDDESETKEDFIISILLRATRQYALELLEEIKDGYESESEVVLVELNKR